MADVLIVCVREDEPQAKALAEMFEAAGFSIGGAPSSDGALRSSGAGLVVWSQASIRSRPFLDAAQRVINANKAVVASLIDPPPPSSIGDSPAFDLSQWDGDPNDPVLDPLFFAVDRMVNAARAGVGASSAPEAPAYDPPPQPRRAPPPPAPQAPTFTRPGADPLSTDAEHWRAIRDSRNPSDFMDYLARFGPEGAFAEVAELRLKQLTNAQSADVRAPAPRPTTPPAPSPRTPIAPRVAMPPTRTPEPRRFDPPPAAARRPEPQRRPPPPERNFDRADLREPPRREGGALRAFILVALLGGAALAGGLYFGGGMQDVGGSQEEQIAAPSDPSGEAPMNIEPDGAPDPLSLDEAIDPTPRRAEVATRQPAAREPTPREQPRAEREVEAPPPAPTTSWAGGTPPNSGGPVSLSPGASPPSTSPSISPVPLNPTSPTTTAPVSTRPPTPARAATVSWAQRPSARRISDLYPSRALREGVGGRVEMSCTVLADLSVSCSVANESPAGQGFGRAALSASSSYRANPTRSDGSSPVGSRTRIVVVFQAPE